jgi:hypothetical protein
MLGQDAILVFPLSGNPLALHSTPTAPEGVLPAEIFMMAPVAGTLPVEGGSLVPMRRWSCNGWPLS